MPEDTEDRASIAQIKSLISQDYSEKVLSFISDLQEGKVTGLERFWEMMKAFVDPNKIRGWTAMLLWIEAEDGGIVKGRKMVLHPSKNKLLRERFISDLLQEISVRLTESKDMLTTIGYLRGAPEFVGRPASSLSDMYGMMAQKRRN